MLARRRPPTFRYAVRRALALALLACAVVAAGTLPGHLLDDGDQWATTRATPQPVWTAELATAYPRCGDRASWVLQHPGRDRVLAATPESVVVIRLDDTPTRMPWRTAERRVDNPDRRDDVRVVGWCG